MKKVHDEKALTIGWLRKSPASRFDLRSKRDPYWRLRALGYSHSYAKLAHRGESLRVVSNKVPDATSLCEEYGGTPDDIIPIPGDHFQHVLKRVEIAVRPESLTEKVVMDAGALGREYSIADRRVPGLALRVRSSGHKSYVLYFRIREEKKTQKIRIGSAGALTLEMAREIARGHLGVAQMGRDPTLWRFNESSRRLEKRGDD